MEIYDQIKQHFAEDSRVAINKGKGAQGMKVLVKGKAKMIIMFSKGDLLLQMPPATIQNLLAKNKGLPYDPGTGKAMKDRILVPASKKKSWIELTELAIQSANDL